MKYLLALALCASASFASAAKWYVGLSHMMMDYKEQGLSGSYTPTMAAALGGVRLSEHFAIEGLYAVGTRTDERPDDNPQVGGENLDIGVTSLMQGRGVFLVPLDMVFHWYSYASFTQFELNSAIGEDATKETVSQGSDYGLGTGLSMGNGHWRGFIEYGRFYNQKLENRRLQLNSVQLGVTYQF